MVRLGVTFYEWDCCSTEEMVGRYEKKSVASNVERKNVEIVQGKEVMHIIIEYKCSQL